MPHSHRPGGLRQSNKAHKGGGKGISKRKRRTKAGAGRVESTGASGNPNTEWSECSAVVGIVRNSVGILRIR